MSIVGASGQSSSLYKLLQTPNASSTSGVAASTSVDTDGDADGSRSAPSTSGSQTAANTSSTTPSLAQQLETAIQNALSGVNSRQSNNPQDLLTSIEKAVQSTLQQNGINPSQASKTHGHHHHGGRKGGAGSAELAALNANGTSSSITANPSTASETPGLDSLLSQINVDPQQFRNDIVSAVSSTQNGSVDPSQVFQNFPPGQSINSLA